MEQLSVEEATKVAIDATYQFQEFPSMRIGQCLYNHLPKRIRDELEGTENDFYYWEDVVKVGEFFWKSLVDYSEGKDGK